MCSAHFESPFKEHSRASLYRKHSLIQSARRAPGSQGKPSPSRLTCLMFCREQNESFILHSFPLPLLLFLSINNTNMCERTKEGDGQEHKTIRSLAPNLSHVGETSNWEILVPKTVTPTTLSLHPDELETIWKSPFYEFPSIRTPLFFIQCSVI